MEKIENEFLSHWSRIWHALTPPDPRPLHDRYLEPARHYHNAAHIVDVLEKIAAAQSAGVTVSRALCLAAFYHDAIYDSRRRDNEEQSALLARQALAPHLPPEEVSAVERMIRATDHRTPPAEADAQLLVDADLSILGSPVEVFEAYEVAIRREYAWVPEEDFRTGRAAVLRHFLERPRIFLTAPFRQYESPALVNLQRSLDKLRK